MPAFILCMHPVARDTALALLAALVLVAVVMLRSRRILWIPFVVCLLLIALASWLGSYRFSPLGFSSGRIQLINGFLITRPQQAQTLVSPMQTVTVATGAAIGIDPQMLPGPVTCFWSSANGGAFDDPASCDTAYSPGQGAGFDVLRVDIRSACGLPGTVSQLNISMLP